MTFELFRIMTIVSSDDISFGFIFGLILNVMTTLVPMAVPISIFFSTIFCLSRMSGDSEYIALRAAGLTKFSIFKPFLVVSIMVAIVVFFFNQQLVPNAHKMVRQKIKIISSTSLIQGLKSGQFFTSLSNTTIFPSEIDEVSKDFKNIFLHIFEPGEKVDKIIMASRGKILHKKNEETGIESFKLLLQDGNIVNKSADGGELEKILFKEYTLPISEKRFSYKTSLKEIMMNLEELSALIDGGLDKAIERGFKKKEYLNAKYEYWQRWNTPVLCILLTFMGFGLGVTSNRGKSKNTSSRAIFILIGYYVVYFTLVSVSRDSSVPVQTAVVIPGLLLLALGMKQYRSMDWLS